MAPRPRTRCRGQHAQSSYPLRCVQRCIPFLCSNHGLVLAMAFELANSMHAVDQSGSPGRHIAYLLTAASPPSSCCFAGATCQSHQMTRYVQEAKSHPNHVWPAAYTKRTRPLRVETLRHCLRGVSGVSPAAGTDKNQHRSGAVGLQRFILSVPLELQTA